MKQVKILIVDDHPIMREALQNGIDQEPDLEVVGTAQDGKDAIEKIQILDPHIVLLDLYMPVMNGLETLSRIRDEKRNISVIILTSSQEDHRFLQAIQAGAFGYLLKHSTRDQILDCIRKVAAGGKYFPTEFSDVIANELQSKQRFSGILTIREDEILQLLGEGLSNHDIAVRLHLSPSTVRVHIHNILNKLKLENRWQAAQYAINRIKKY